MKKLSKRLRAQSGLTLIETLAAAVILTLLCLALNSGMDIATHTYRSVTAESETQLDALHTAEDALSTAADALTQELRYAAPSKDQTAGTLGTYTSASYGSGAKIDINDGHLVIVTAAQPDGVLLLPTGVYGKNDVYDLSFGDDGIRYDPEEKLFTFTLRAEQADLAYAEQEFTVRCLNGGTT